MYKPLKSSQYKKLSYVEKINELSKYLEEELADIRCNVKAISGCTPEANEEIASVIDTPLNELPTLMGDFHEESVAYTLLKYRMKNNIETCDDSILDTDEMGIVIAKESNEDEGAIDDINTIRNHIDDHMFVLCNIFGLEALRKSFEAWRP